MRLVHKRVSMDCHFVCVCGKQFSLFHFSQTLLCSGMSFLQNDQRIIDTFSIVVPGTCTANPFRRVLLVDASPHRCVLLSMSSYEGLSFLSSMKILWGKIYRSIDRSHSAQCLRACVCVCVCVSGGKVREYACHHLSACIDHSCVHVCVCVCACVR